MSIGKLIEVTDLSHSYGSNEVLDKLSLTLDEGKFYTILGENGVGKSTLMRILSGLESFDSGSVKVDGKETFNEDFQVCHPVALISEDLNFETNTSLKNLLGYFSSFYPKWNQEKFEHYINVREFDLDRTYDSMSRGQKVQLALMLYLSSGVKTFIVDEITSVLDLYARNYFLKELKEIVNEGGTVIFGTNIITEVQSYTDHIILLQDKGIRMSMTMEEVPKNFIKLRRQGKDEHEIFNDKNCHWSGDNIDGSTCYIVSSEIYSQHGSPDVFVDRRAISLNDIFVFYFKTKVEVEDEKAA